MRFGPSVATAPIDRSRCFLGKHDYHFPPPLIANRAGIACHWEDGDVFAQEMFLNVGMTSSTTWSPLIFTII
jgi:hypothetical protein